MNNIFSSIRKRKVFRFIAAFIAINMLAQIFSPTIAWALTSGPSQPEVQSFEPAGTSDMVDLFSGDFNYNIPLFDLPGPNGSYPFNLAYHSGIGMDQEASWVGLGWNVNPGAINRDKRGLPDDFNGEPIETYLDMKRNETFGSSVAVGLELWGGTLTSGSTGNLNLGLTVYNNSYKGIGYSLDPSISRTSDNSSVNFGLSLDSQEGVGANADVSFGSNLQGQDKTTKYGGTLGGSFNSQRGLSLTVSGFADNSARDRGKSKSDAKSKVSFGGSGGSTYSFAEKAFMPAFTSPMEGSNLGVSIKFGIDGAGAFSSLTIGGFYRSEGLKNFKNTYKAYGYNYLESADAGSLMDFNREKDGIIRKETPNLPAPVLTMDTYMALGQGFLGSYRAHRSDIGHLHDPFVESKISGGSIGVELGPGYPVHLGVTASFNETNLNSGDWTENNNWETGLVNYTFYDGSAIGKHNYEKLYYKIKGEPTSFDSDEMDYVGGESAVRASLQTHGSFLDRFFNPASGLLIPSSGADKTIADAHRTGERINRNNSIQPITNDLLLNGSTSGPTELLGEYKLKYYNSPSMEDGKYLPQRFVTYNRTGLPKYQTAGFTCINPSGLRYVYALPAYNTIEKETAFTISPLDYNSPDENTNYLPSIVPISYLADPTTDQFYSRTETPAYTHAHLLTSVLGADYVDADAIPGPSDGDYGYWVKFNYVKTSTAYDHDYRWRAPYEGAMYLRGQNLRASDDKAIYSYGEKEIWYLASAETKSHVAVFKLSERHDGLEAKGEYVPNNPDDRQKLYKVDEINLYSKPNYNNSASPLVPLKTVHFSYSYDLCGNVPNNDGINTDETNRQHGKLTLKKVWFTYQNNTRGELSPYTFNYNESNTTTENPNYSVDSYDRWGGYKNNNDFYKTGDADQDNCIRNLPYVSQFIPAELQDQSHKNDFKQNTDKNAAVWNLKSIRLPTGGSIDINYEADDYAYVQHRQATQMFQILRLSDAGEQGKVYGFGSNWSSGDHSQRQVYFKLENPIPVLTGDVQKLYKDYLSGIVQSDGNLQMYFRLKSQLRDNVYETVIGYSNLENGSLDYGFDDSSTNTVIDGINCHTIGYVTLKLMNGQNSALPSSGPTIDYHPFAVAAWQYMRINEPELLTAFGNLGNASPGSSAMDKAMKVKNLLSVIPAVIQTFTGYRRYAFNHGWGRHIDLTKSFIRLATPDKIKYGGGLRVKRITYNDNWSNSSSTESSNEYGQVYNYTTIEGEGADAITISSGVAQYEPLIGGDEIALRHPKNYMQTIPLFTDNNLFFEYPINESYYPGPSVGYSKVTVQSIASYETTANNPHVSSEDARIPSTGLVEYKFYTAKEYPVITDETFNQVEPVNLYIPIPLIGQITSNKLYETQGYAITLNDMHGKLKSITNYSKNINGEINPIPVSSVRYLYKSTTKQFDGQTVNLLDNTVPAIVNEYIDPVSTNSTYQKMICKKKNVVMGEEYDFFVDSRQSHVHSTQGGLELNIEWAWPLPFPCPWPSFSSSTKNLKTLATNKVIQKSAILETTIATDGQSVVKTTNKLFDAQTGSPLLTVVTNDFDKPVYNYNHPAYWDYEGMGAAALNHNYSFYAKVNTVNSSNNTFTIYNGPSGTSPSVTKNVSTSTFPFPPPYAIDPADFYKTIAEGDELIMQPISTTSSAKYMATLITKSTTYGASCGMLYNLVFHSANGASTLSSNTSEVKFTIVRSGRRNMLSTNIGSIAALKDPTEDANRGLFTATAGSVNIAPELALLFNSLLNSDCAVSNGNQLPLTTINFSGEEYFNQNGEPLYPTLSSFFNYITIGYRPVTDACHNEYAGSSSPLFYEYFMKFSYIDESGSCQTGECCLGLYGIRYCFSPTTCVLTPFSLLGFSSSNGNLVVTYDRKVTDLAPETVTLNCISVPTNLKYTYIDDVISSSSVLYRHFWDYDSWANITCEAPPNGTPDQTNLYSLGKKGIWKPYMNYYYKDQRVNEQLSSDVKLSHDGVYKGDGIVTNLNEFYLFPWRPTVTRPIPVKWMPNSLVSMYDQNSNAMQTQDIVKINSSVLYGYNNQLPIIQGNNSERNELFYESFDDPSSSNYALNIANIPHTGKKSLTVVGGSNVDLHSLSLKEGKSYTVSLWVSNSSGKAANYATNAGLGVALGYYNASNTLISWSPLIRPSGNVIEGWQRIEGDFTIPTGTKKVVLVCYAYYGGVSYTYYFDDIRIFPTLSNVSTSVYDATNFRISAVLDANNFATFYNYDEEGKLFMVKKETIDGIKTIKEERGHIKE